MRIACLFAVAFCLQIPASAQAVVETAVATSGSAAASAAGQGIGKSIGSVFDSLNRKLAKAKDGDQPASQSKSEASTSVLSPSAEQRLDAPKLDPIDPTAVRPGMARTDLIAKIGSPSLKVTRNDGPAFLETMWYERPGQPDTVIRLKNGVVDRVDKSLK